MVAIVTVQFFSPQDYGLVLRATCLPLANWYLPGCANLQDIVMLPGAQAFVDKTFNVSTSSLARRQDRSVHTVQETSFLQEVRNTQVWVSVVGYLSLISRPFN